MLPNQMVAANWGTWYRRLWSFIIHKRQTCIFDTSSVGALLGIKADMGLLMVESTFGGIVALALLL